ncbi:hypothetical protein [Streptosporangium sp. NBC_01469]|uniref:hypothetical protein n=1 Tax=Streptosporangium sp. NBC_01469 TaxID=2903898 RepID=UPI002E2817C1|nr:hypothetical protein [Streptosporangium sp. NBC_01469]
MKKLIGSAAVSMLAAASILASATGASAATASGSCSTSGLSATGRIEYTNSGSNHNVSSYTWTINGQSGSTANDVNGQVRHDRNNVPDERLHSFSTTNARNGNGSSGIGRSWPTSYALFGQFTFVFDRNNATDPSCTATTGRF